MNQSAAIAFRQLGKTAALTEYAKTFFQMTNKYTITHNSRQSLVTAESSLSALMEFAEFLKKNGQTSYQIEVSKNNNKLGVWVRA